MDYKQTIEYLFTQTPVFQRDGASAYKPGLDTARKLAAAFGNPQDSFRTIHVAGTNGKGSTAHTLAAVLSSAGLRTGLYTSPHLTDFRERIRVDGHMVSKEFVTAFVEKYLQHEDLTALHPSFFELTTIMAFEWFRQQKVDIAVIEVGLGGRLDTTNIITPELSIITNISLDHTALLGDSHEAVASEKAGIIKPGVPVVIGNSNNPAVRSVFEKKAASVSAPLYYAEMPEISLDADGRWIYDGWIHGELRGEFQPYNAATVLTALKVLNLPEVTRESIDRGFANVEEFTGLRGRLSELKGEKCHVVYDTGHNPGAWEYLGPYLAKVKATRKLIVIGFAADKDVNSILDMMPHDAKYIFTKPSGNRGLDAEILAEMASAHGLHGRSNNNVAEAVNEAIESAGNDGFVFVGGSNFVVADLLTSRGL